MSSVAAQRIARGKARALRAAAVGLRVGGRVLRSRWFKIAVALLALPWVVLAIAAACTELPAQLRESTAPDVSLVVRDRHGVILREYRAHDGVRARWIPLSEMGERVPKALVAAEDLRFWRHPGVDPLSMLRAAGQLAWNRRIVSGASTLTQQLARTLEPRPRTLHGKLGEMALAARIEASLSKAEILEQYLNRVSFGPNLRGIEAASRFYFDKPTRDLSLAEAAALAGMPRGPALYDPRKGTGRLLHRRNTVLERMRGAGLASEGEIERALAEPFQLAARGGGLGAPHMVQALVSGNLPDLGEARGGIADLTLTIDRGLQATIEVLAHDTVVGLKRSHVSAAAVVVLDNASGEVLAYVGSHDFGDVAGLGQNDGVLMRRQPGSTLKPFVYGLAMERLGFTAATLLPDVETHFPTGDGDFTPNNYDGRFHGAVLLREALANSYNVPAVRAAAALGPDRVLARLHEHGFASLDRTAADYGVAIALGDGETRLIELVNGYATLARRGRWLPVVAVRAAALAGGGALVAKRESARQVSDPSVALVLADILSDDRARAASFGRGSALDMPFPAAVKTGTSKGFRDNLTVGFTREVTVAVWVGNFDGSPMDGVSGVTGAGPLFRGAMTAAQGLYPGASRAPLREQLAEVGQGGGAAAGGGKASGVSAAAVASIALAREAAPLELVEVCPLSGELRGADCPHGQVEVFPGPGSVGRAPRGSCEMHVRVRVDRRNGLRAGEGCAEAQVEERVFERYPPDLAEWGRTAHRPVAPAGYSPLCPAGPGEVSSVERPRLRLSYPPDGASFVWDPHVGSRQSIVLRAATASPAGLVFHVDGVRLTPRAGEAQVVWPLAPGAHRVWATAGDQKSDVSQISVEE